MKKKGGYHSNQPGARHAVSEFDNPRNKPDMGKGPAKSYPKKSSIEAAGHEIKTSPPSILKNTERKFGRKAAQKQRVAIMLAKARRSKG